MTDRVDPDHGLGAAALGSLTSPEVADRGPQTLLIPLGATEQHGPHLPLNTDTIVACAWAAAVGRRVRGSIVGPALAYGSSGEHQDFPGTLSVGGPALQTMLVELARSALGPLSRVVYLSGHAGNAEPLAAAVELLRGEGRDVVGLVPTWPGRPVDAHAGRTETSLLLHLAPEQVRRDRSEVGDRRPLAVVIDQLRSEGVAAVAPNGILGDPTGASAEEGFSLFADLVERTVDLLT